MVGFKSILVEFLYAEAQVTDLQFFVTNRIFSNSYAN